MHGIMVPLGLLILLSITFVSDYRFLDLPAFYLCWLALILFRAIASIRLTAAELATQLLILAFILPTFAAHLLEGEHYHNSLFFILLYVNSFPLLEWILQRRASLIFWLMVLLSCFFAFSIISIAQGVVRARIIFGPNVLYRIYLFLFGMLIIALFYFRAPGRKVSMSWPLALAMFYALVVVLATLMIATGSRGGLVATLLSLLLIMASWRFLVRHNHHAMAVGVLALLLAAGVAVSTFMGDVLGRLLFFNPSSESEAVRIGFLIRTWEFVKSEDLAGLVFGVGPTNKYFDFYPHNIFAEALVYGGVYQLLVIAVCFLGIAIAIVKRKSEVLLIIPFMGIIIGSLFSGSLLYNYPVIALGGYLLIKLTRVDGLFLTRFNGTIGH